MSERIETETIDRLYLELSQFTTATTKREHDLLAHIDTLVAALFKFGRHSETCRWFHHGHFCNCPFGDALNAAGLSRPGVNSPGGEP